ncbi:MAG TPA: purine-nucleoside phosphorylase [Polyangiaceae bacterium]|nr:purine-nucleoside phosphorylase [Polyangiaceae bacterium]
MTSASDATSPSPVSDPKRAASAALAAAAAFVQRQHAPPPRVGVVLGSGLGAWAERLQNAHELPYASIPHMPTPSVPGHPGELWLGQLGGASVACLRGRVHAYEGHPVERVVFGARLLAALGCRAVLLTNAAGGIRSDLSPGSLMLITDHVNLSGLNPLVGWGDHPGFIDMTRAYDRGLAAAARDAAGALGLTLGEGVYAALLGPSYETPAEIRMLRTLGADAVGMSTALEVIALRERGVAVGAVSCITNAAAGLSSAALDHDDVQQTAARARDRFEALLDAWVERAAALYA